MNLNVKYNDKIYVLKVHVIKKGGPPLIGRNGLNMLGLGISKIRYCDFKTVVFGITNLCAK